MKLNGTEVREYFNRENYEYFSMGLRLTQKSYRLLKKANSEFTGASYLSIHSVCAASRNRLIWAFHRPVIPITEISSPLRA